MMNVVYLGQEVRNVPFMDVIFSCFKCTQYNLWVSYWQKSETLNANKFKKCFQILTCLFVEFLCISVCKCVCFK